jgi:hypothetical protein
MGVFKINKKRCHFESCISIGFERLGQVRNLLKGIGRHVCCRRFLLTPRKVLHLFVEMTYIKAIFLMLIE